MKSTSNIPKEFAGKSPAWIRDRVWHVYLTSSWVGGDLIRDEDQVNFALGDTNIRIRFNKFMKHIEVWYEPRNSRRYCVAVYELGDYFVGRVIRELKERQSSARDLRRNYIDITEDREKQTRKKRRNVADAFAKDYVNILRGKVTSSG